MSNAISIDKVIESTLNGIDESMNLYQEWSGGEWLWNAPEYLITVKIAENIANIQGSKYITLEDNVDYILDVANAKGQGRIPEEIRKNGRSDIVLWWADETPRAVIEVKNSVFRLGKISGDIDRIQEILKRKKANNTLQFGLIAFYIDNNYKSGNAQIKIEEKIKKIHNEMKKQYPDLSCKLFYRIQESNDEYNAWSSVVFLLKIK